MPFSQTSGDYLDYPNVAANVCLSHSLPSYIPQNQTTFTYDSAGSFGQYQLDEYSEAGPTDPTTIIPAPTFIPPISGFSTTSDQLAWHYDP